MGFNFDDYDLICVSYSLDTVFRPEFVSPDITIISSWFQGQNIFKVWKKKHKEKRS